MLKRYQAEVVKTPWRGYDDDDDDDDDDDAGCALLHLLGVPVDTFYVAKRSERPRKPEGCKIRKDGSGTRFLGNGGGSVRPSLSSP